MSGNSDKCPSHFPKVTTSNWPQFKSQMYSIILNREKQQPYISEAGIREYIAFVFDK